MNEDEDAENARDAQVIGQIAVGALKVLNRIHALTIEDEPGAIEEIRSLALTTIVEAEAQIDEIREDDDDEEE